MKKVIGISTSHRSHSKSIKFLDALKKRSNEYFIHFDLKTHSETDIHCSACDQCNGSYYCVKNSNHSLIEEVLKSDVLIFAFPIYYGAISGKSKSLLESFYCLKNGELKGKKVIFILSSEKENQEGIAVIELLPWIYKHGLKVSLIETLYDEMGQSKIEEMIEKIERSIQEEHTKDMEIEFCEFEYFKKKVGVPSKFNEV